MTLILCLLAFAAGVYLESRLDLSGRALQLWRRFNAWRRG